MSKKETYRKLLQRKLNAALQPAKPGGEWAAMRALLNKHLPQVPGAPNKPGRLLPGKAARLLLFGVPVAVTAVVCLYMFILHAKQPQRHNIPPATVPVVKDSIRNDTTAHAAKPVTKPNKRAVMPQRVTRQNNTPMPPVHTPRKPPRKITYKKNMAADTALPKSMGYRGVPVKK